MAKATLEINKLILSVYIGVEDYERIVPQDIEINIVVEFETLPKACYTDSINDTICYDKLVSEIKKFCFNKGFHLIENLAYLVHRHLKTSFTSNKIKLQVSKKPPIDDIKGSCSFLIYE
jgi:dihydroneopterin aldolase